MGKDNEYTADDVKQQTKEQYGKEESGKKIAKADHDARDDYQKDGEPFGPLDKRK